MLIAVPAMIKKTKTPTEDSALARQKLPLNRLSVHKIPSMTRHRSTHLELSFGLQLGV
jgi:hypothetical protein